MAQLFMLSFLLMLVVTPFGGQEEAAVEQRIEALRQQLRDVIDKQSQLEARQQQLDESLKPEEIEKSVAGIGTTDAAAVRDQRRQQLEREKISVDEQLQSLGASRIRLESAIANAEAEAVRLKAAALAPKESAPRNPPVAAPVAPTPAPVVRKKAPASKRMPRKRSRPRRRT